LLEKTSQNIKEISSYFDVDPKTEQVKVKRPLVKKEEIKKTPIKTGMKPKIEKTKVQAMSAPKHHQPVSCPTSKPPS
jgi:hypothetical protein